MQEAFVPEGRRWVNRAVAHEVDRERVRWLWAMFFGMMLAAAPFAAYLLEQNECLGRSYEASSLRAEHERLLENERRLRMQRAALESLESIERWALTRRHLVHPSPEQVVVIQRGSPVENPTPNRTE
jgi:cell division protein FtsL